MVDCSSGIGHFTDRTILVDRQLQEENQPEAYSCAMMTTRRTAWSRNIIEAMKMMI